MTSIDRTAYPRFKRVISGLELAEAFTPTLDEIAWARSRTQTDQYFLALVIRLKCYQRLSYFAKLTEVPGAVSELYAATSTYLMMWWLDRMPSAPRSGIAGSCAIGWCGLHGRARERSVRRCSRKTTRRI